MTTIGISNTSEEASRRSKGTGKAAAFMAMLFLIPLLANAPGNIVDPLTMPTSGKTTDPDVAVTDLNVTTPSVMIAGVPTLSPENHIIRVSILNMGGSSADGDLVLKVNGNEVDSRNVSINPGQQEVHLLYWAASPGTGISLNAVWEVDPSSSDSDSSNDEMSISGITVASVEDAAPISDSLPQNGDTLARAQWAGAITVVNTGNQPVNVTAQLSLTSSASGEQISISSTTSPLSPGSLANPPEPQNISLSFDGSNLEGTYTLAGSLLITGSGSPSTVTIQSRTVSFVALRATLIGANNRNLDPGAETILNFILQNSGDEGDNFTVSQTNTSNPGEYWANISGSIYSLADPLFVDSGQTVAIQVPLQVPTDAQLGDSVRVTVSVQSIAAGYVLSASTVVMAGGLFQSEIFQNHSHPDGAGFSNLTPGVPTTLDYTLKNTGTAPTQYQIFVAATEPVPHWVIYSPITTTDVLMPNETRTIPVTITTPELRMPIDPAWKVGADLQVQLGIQAIPLDGGLPSANLTTLILDRVVELEIEVTGSPANVSADEFIAGSVSRYVDFQVRLVHNLGSNDSQAQVTLSPTEAGSGTGKTMTPDASAFEYTRWVSSITPSTMEISPGEIGYGVVGIVHQPYGEFQYPAAGVFNFEFTSTSDWGNFPGTISKDASTNITFAIGTLYSAELTTGETGVGDPATAISASMNLKNTGNDLADFSINVIPIEGWDIAVSKPSVSQMRSRTNLYPLVESGDTSDATDFTVTATPPATASADTTHEVWVYVNSSVTGELLSYAPAYFQLSELTDAQLSPGNSTAIIDRLGQSTIMLQLNNSGNSNRTFDLSLDNHDPTEIQVSFADDGTVQLSKQQLIAPGGQAIVRIYALAGTTARADSLSKFEVAVSGDGVELDRSGISVQVNPFHSVNMQMNRDYTAVPGGTLSVPINLINEGNLMEILAITAEVPAGWNQTTNQTNISIEPGLQGVGVTLSITLPSLAPGTVLAADEVHTIEIYAWNVSDGTECITRVEDLDGDGIDDFPCPGSTNITITILPVFSLSVCGPGFASTWCEAPERIAVLPGSPRVVEYTIENTGNAPMSIGIGWDLEDVAGIGEADRFSVQIQAEQNPINLAIGQKSTIAVTIQALASDHYRLETASVSIIFTPIGIDLDVISIATPIKVVRVQTDELIVLNSDGPFACGPPEPSLGGCVEISIPWQHVPSLGVTDASIVDYNLSLADTPERMVDYWMHPDTTWSFMIDDECVLVSTNDPPGIGPQDDTCTSGWDIGSATPYLGGTIVMQIRLPDKKNLAPGDGWDIELRLKNPNEPDNFEFWTDFTVKLRMTEASDPMIDSVSFNGTNVEGSQTTIDVTVINAGNARMPIDTEVWLTCTGNYAAVVDPQSQVVPDLEAGANYTASWAVTIDPLPWHSTSEPFDCFAELKGTVKSVFGNNVTNDIYNASLPIASWSPPSLALSAGGFEFSIPLVSILGLLVLLGSLSMLQRGMEGNPNRLHLSSYVAAAAFGMISMGNPTSWAISVCAVATIAFAGLVSWLSSSELQAIHDDRKKARIGVRSVLDDHDDEQANTRKELRAIISFSPFAFLPFVLITPALSIDLGAQSIASLLLFMIISPALVHLILRFLDKSYDSLYGELAELELRAIKIRKILGSVGKTGGRR